MKSILLSPTILLLSPTPTLASDYTPPALTTVPLNPHTPIYLGDVFWPPTMTLLAWLPSEQKTPTEWCWKATDVSGGLFSLGGVDALRVHDYFGGSGSGSGSESESGDVEGTLSGNAYISREGKRWADCRITPESGRMGACEGVRGWDCEGGHRYTGPGTRQWSCWVRDVVEYERAVGSRNGNGNGNGTQQVEREGGITDALAKGTEVVTGAVASGSIVGAFTAGVTGV